MSTISASAPPARIRTKRFVAKEAQDLGAPITPRDRAGKDIPRLGADVPPWTKWPAALALATFILFGPEVLGWLLRMAL